jgi:hypothetical protein
MPTRLLTGEGRADREETDKHLSLPDIGRALAAIQTPEGLARQVVEAWRFSAGQ